jgi:DNA-binding response OmpR family regulator/HPt (histidine-containing phosphotransfer) domain-containing protein
MRILLVEDDAQLAALVRNTLVEQQYVVDVATDGQEGWDLAEAIAYDLIVLDVMLPKLDGVSFCRKLRSQGSQALVLLLTARAGVDDKIVGLDAGADDYLVKPIGLPELTARIRALLRRRMATVASVLEWGALQLNLDTHEITYHATPLSLTAKEYALLELFLRNNHHIFSQRAIITQLWSLEADPPGEETVRAHIKRLRQKLNAVGAESLIETVYGLGYRLNQAFHLKKEPTPESTLPDLGHSLETDQKTPKEQILNRVAVIEQGTQFLLKKTFNRDAYDQACRECHKLIGLLGMIGLPQGSELTQKIEGLFQTEPLSDAQKESLTYYVSQLRDLIQTADLQTLELCPSPPSLSTGQPIRLLLVEQDQEWIDGWITEAGKRGMQTAIAHTLTAAQAAIERVLPDAVAIDLSQFDTQAGLKLLEELEQLSIPTLVLTDPRQTSERVDIARRQGRGFLSKSIAPEKILEAIVQAVKPISPAITKIVVLDDDRMVLRLLRVVLEPWGMQIVTLNHSLNFWQELAAAQPDLLILDVNLPEIDGIELCHTLRNDSQWAWLPILFLTGQQDSETIQKIFAAGADDYACKPIIAPELVTRILNRLERVRVLRQVSCGK